MNTIRTIDRRETLIGAVVVFFLILCLGYYVYATTRGAETLGNERFHNSLVSEGLSIETEVIGLRRLEREFVIQSDLNVLNEFEKSILHVQNKIDKELKDKGVDGADFFLAALSNYRLKAEKLFSFYRSKGLNHNAGLEGELRKSAHSAEEIIRAEQDMLLLAELMYLRRHEKDFMMRGDNKYILKFSERMGGMIALVDQRIRNSNMKSSLLADLNNYNSLFIKWSSIVEQVNETLQDVDVAYVELDRVMKDIIRRSVQEAQASEHFGNNHRKWSQISISVLGVLGIIAFSLLVSMIYRHKKLAIKIDKIAHVDALTSLPNRRSFFQNLENKIFQASRMRTHLSIGIIDLDGFKAVNDVHGHGAGDQLLEAVGRRLRATLDDEIMLARLGGDEFGIIIHSKQSDIALKAIGDLICAQLKQPFQLKETVARIAGTVGFAQYPDVATCSNLLFEYADFALYHAKENCKGTAVLFSGDHELEISGRRQLEQCLLEANLEAELDVFFQPIVDSVDGQVVGMEALARWESPVIGTVSPDKFISAAESLGVVGNLTSILFRKSLNTAKFWPKSTYLSFNLSAIDIASKETALKLMSLIMESGFPPNRIVFEITETTMMLDFNHANEVLKPFRNLGVEIALDDFGTGYSSLSYIQKMPIDRLKVDRAFISDIETRKTTRDIMATVVELCSSLEIKCIVEGVETYKQLETVELLGCRLIQGYYFSKPLCAEDAQKFLDERSLSSINDWQCIA